MANSDRSVYAPWLKDDLPKNVQIGENSLLSGQHAFRRFFTQQEVGLSIGHHCTMDGVQFAIGESGQVQIGDNCYFTNVILLCELEIRIGSYVMIGWNTTIGDSDFHPIDPAQRILDAKACSPLLKNTVRPLFKKTPVVIGNDVWIGPNATILKGVNIGTGSFIEPGSLITHDIPPYSRVMGNPARIIGSSQS